MTIALKRILLVTRDVRFAIDVKRALESLGEYAVTPVTEARNAIEQLRRKPHHLVLLDIEDLAIAPAVMIDLIRARQGEIAIVLAPDVRAAHDLAKAYNAQGVVDIPVSSRFLIPILEGSLKDIYEALPQTVRLPAIDIQEDTANIETLVDDLLDDQTMPSYTVQKLQASYRLLHPTDEGSQVRSNADDLELVIESDDDGDTIRYRHMRLDDHDSSTIANEDENTPFASPGGGTTVRDMGRALASSAFDTSELATTMPDGQQSDADSLAGVLREVEDENTTIESLYGPGIYGKTARASPADLGQTTLPADLTFSDEAATTDAARSASVAEPAESDGSAPVPLFSKVDDPYVRQLAVVMTQTMSELTAEATLLTLDDAIVAYAGELQPDDLNDLRQAIENDWTAEPGRARLRFLTLPDDGRHFMLYSRGTIDGLTLSLVFAGSKSLTAINRQGDRMLQALAQAPTMDETTEDDDSNTRPAPALAGVPDAPTRIAEAFTFVWLVADPATQLSQNAAKQLVFWLELQLNSLGWTLRRIDVHQDFVYLVADIPPGAAPEELVQDLMARSERIVRSEDQSLPQDLWADAYLVLQPGRDLDMRELQGFLRFVRADN